MSTFRDRIRLSAERTFRHVSSPATFVSGETALGPVASVREFSDVESLSQFEVPPMRQEANALAFLRSEVVERPVRHDRITRDDGVFEVTEPARCLDRLKIFWICNVREIQTP